VLTKQHFKKQLPLFAAHIPVEMIAGVLPGGIRVKLDTPKRFTANWKHGIAYVTQAVAGAVMANHKTIGEIHESLDIGSES